MLCYESALITDSLHGVTALFCQERCFYMAYTDGTLKIRRKTERKWVIDLNSATGVYGAYACYPSASFIAIFSTPISYPLFLETVLLCHVGRAAFIWPSRVFDCQLSVLLFCTQCHPTQTATFTQLRSMNSISSALPSARSFWKLFFQKPSVKFFYRGLISWRTWSSYSCKGHNTLRKDASWASQLLPPPNTLPLTR